MLNKLKIGKYLLVIVFTAGIFSLIGFSGKISGEKVCTKVVLNIDAAYDNYFVTEEDALDLLTDDHEDLLEGAKYSDISLKLLEQRMRRHKFVEDVQVYKDHKGKLIVDIKQAKPVARLIQARGPHAYISGDGKLLPFSSRFTARVLLVGGDYVAKLKEPGFLKTEEGLKYLHLINRLEKDVFWKAQIAEMYVQKNGEIMLYPQVGDEVVEFGTPEDIEEKLTKLKVYYKKIIPMKGYNSYSRVKLKFKDQIICE
jgi:cell division protein FtsQ